MFGDLANRLGANLRPGKKIFNTLAVGCIPAANRLTVGFIDIRPLHFKIASAGSLDNRLSG